MNKLTLTNFSVRHPWITLGLAALIVILFGAQFPNVYFDNDPENMLSEDEHVRVFHNQVKERFALYDFVIVGIVNTTHPDGIFNVDTLNRIHALTTQLLSLDQGADGRPVVTSTDPATPERTLDLSPDGAWKRLLNIAFNHDPNNLFDEEGASVIIGRELIAPSVVDNIKQAELGSLKLEYLMESPPSTREQALTIRDDAMNNPLYKGTLVAEDEKAMGLYIPVTEKKYSYNVANLVRELTRTWQGDDEVYITGLPVAEDTFGIEMLVQMSTSAPLAGLAIFLLMLAFFRRVSLIIAPMVVAVFSVVCTMGLLIGLGLPVHIMSSMIAIFLMPIAVADAVHILSEFFDTYHRFSDKAATVRHVIQHLFRPMLYTSLTTMAGFGSLAMTPIPPVRVFGLHVAFGVGLAWLMTMTLVPAYIMVCVPKKTLRNLAEASRKDLPPGRLNRMLEWLGAFGYRRCRMIVSVAALVFAVSIYGMTRIEVNDNPVKWFTRNHPIRVADRVLNRHFGGTYTAYLTLHATTPTGVGCEQKAALIAEQAQQRFGETYPEATRSFLDQLEIIRQQYRNVASSNLSKCFVQLVNKAEALDEDKSRAWRRLADEINYLNPADLTYDSLRETIRNMAEIEDAARNTLIQRLEAQGDLTGAALQNEALNICDEFIGLSFREFVFQMEAELTAPLFKQPEMLRYVRDLQDHLEREPTVGKTSSAVDALQKASYELRYVDPPADATPQEIDAFTARNASHFSVPDTASGAGQVFIQLEGMKKKDSLFHLVTRDYREANIWVQLKSGDNKDMESVVAALEAYVAANPPPVDLEIEWAGLTYLNVVWQDKMVTGMVSSLISSFIVVLIMMMVLFRSPLFGVLAMIPLSLTISFIYGLIGFVGKDYDMPVAILSALTLGLSVDFAIHFLERAREEQKRAGNWKQASKDMFKEPALAISRNAITISVGFTPLLLAPLVPYRTVGFFLATIMAISWLATLFILPALLTLLKNKAFDDKM